MDGTTLTPVLAKRYSRPTALLHESLYGHGYQGPASEDVFHYLAEQVMLSEGQKVVDIGCGLGGDCFRMSSIYNAKVLGLDASTDMIQICNERKKELRATNIEFKVADMRGMDFLNDQEFDLIWSRDAIAYVNEDMKLSMFKLLYQKLKSDGKVMVTDYCIGSKSNREFDEKMMNWDQYLITIEHYKGLFKQAGFQNIHVQNRTWELREGTAIGMTNLVENKEFFLANYTEEEYQSLLSRWERKLDFMDKGFLEWLVLTASK